MNTPADDTTSVVDAPYEAVARPSARALGWVLGVASALGLVASFELTLERSKQAIALAKGEAYSASCDINALVSCGPVMLTPEAEIFGFPNSLLGLVTFGAMIAAAGAILCGNKFSPLFWWALLLGQAGGIVMVHFLMYTSMFELHVLCPWCILTWFAAIPAFVVTFAYVVSSKVVALPAAVQRPAKVLADYYPIVLLGWLGLITVGLFLEFFLAG